MHRLGHHRRALISCGTRFNSTVAEAEASTTTPARNRRTGVTLRWGTVVIPSREEILKIPKAGLYSPDLSYLEKAPQTSLAGRLAKPKLQPKDISAITEKRKIQRLAREEEAAKLSAARSTSETKTREIEPPDVAAITQKRIERRLAREANKAYNFNETIRTVQVNVDKLSSLGSLIDSPGPLPRSARYPSVERSDAELSPSALKRREERRLRESNPNRNTRSSSRRNTEKSGSVEFDGTETVEKDSFYSAELEAASPAVQAPEFNGPESILETINDFNNFGIIQPPHRPVEHGQHSVKVLESFSYRPNPNTIDSFTGGDYSRYTSSSSASESTSPNALTAVKTAELALAYQRDYIIPQRKHAIEIVKTLVSTNLVQAAKEKQSTA